MQSLHVTDTRMAASLIGLGFAGEVHAITHTRSGKTQIEVRFLRPSTRFPQLNPRMIAAHWDANRFLAPYEYCLPEAAPILCPAEPMHMLAVMMRAQESYDAFLKLQHEGGGMRLVASEKPYENVFYRYQHGGLALVGEEGISEPTEDLCLAAGVGPLGIGLSRLGGLPGARRYELAPIGLPIRDSAGQMVRYRTADLIPFATSGELRLAIEDVNPNHPLVIAYDGLNARQCLKREINRAQTNLLVTAPDGTFKQALIGLNFKGHVGDAVSRHFKAPPGSLGI